MTCIIVQLVKTLFTLIHGNALLMKLGCSSHAALEVLVSLRIRACTNDGHYSKKYVEWTMTDTKKYVILLWQVKHLYVWMALRG